MKMNVFIAGIFLVFVTFSAVYAQDSMAAPENSPSEKWSFLIEPYLMFPSMDGTTGLSVLPDVSIDASSGDIFSVLQIGAMLNLEASKGKWHINSDIIYMNLNQDVTPGTLIAAGDVSAKQFAWGVTGLYSITPWLDLGVGGIFNALKMNTAIDVNDLVNGGTENKSKELSESWFDPMIVVRTSSKPGNKFIYQLRGDIGGFGIGSQLAWQVQAYAGYRFSTLFQLTGGYRIISLDYEKENTGDAVLTNNRFLYDVNTSGPVVRLGFNF